MRLLKLSMQTTVLLWNGWRLVDEVWFATRDGNYGPALVRFGFIVALGLAGCFSEIFGN